MIWIVPDEVGSTGRQLNFGGSVVSHPVSNRHLNEKVRRLEEPDIKLNGFEGEKNHVN